jgi:ATP-dependent DNA ligase
VIEEAEFVAGRSNTPYEQRLAELKDILPSCSKISLIESHTVTAVVDANAIHTNHTSRGLEGTVWKDPNGPWRDSSSGTKDAVKNKVVFEAEYEITGSYEGEGKAAGMLGGIGIKTKCDGLKNNVGSGFSDKQRKELWAIRDELPGKIVTVEANDIIGARGKDTLSLSLGIFIEIRTDKTEADTLERVYEQLEAAKYGRK